MISRPAVNYRARVNSRYRDIDISNTDIAGQRIHFDQISIFYLHFNFYNTKLLISQSKFSGIRKFTLRYQYSGMNFHFEISKVDFVLFFSIMVLIVSVSGDFFRFAFQIHPV